MKTKSSQDNFAASLGAAFKAKVGMAPPSIGRTTIKK